MKNAQFTIPSANEIPNSKSQSQLHPQVHACACRVPSSWTLKPGASLALGTWNVRLLLLCLLISIFCPLASAQTYTIDWHTIDGGGGTSTGGVYSVSGTIGQPDAGAMSGGNFSVTGGFWSLFAVQTPGAPTLTVVPATPGNATISWTPATPGFILQETISLSPTNWVNSPSGSTNPIVVPAALPTKFYRLLKP
jgi:hypothetical protein